MCAACAAWRCCFFFVRFFPRCKKQTSKLQTNCRSLDNFWLQGSHVFAPPTPPPHPKFGSAVGVCSQSFAGSGQTGSPKRSLVFSTKNPMDLRCETSKRWDVMPWSHVIFSPKCMILHDSSKLCIFVAVFCLFLSLSLLLFVLCIFVSGVSPVCILRLELQEKLAVSLDTAACTVSWCRHWGSKRARAQEGK